MSGRLLYSSLIDISLPNGPGVNERLFLKDMIGRLGSDLCAVIPAPSRGMPAELQALDSTFIPSWPSTRSLLGWLGSRLTGAFALSSAIKRFEPDLIVLRIGAFPLPHLLGVRSTGTPYVLKTAGDVSFRAFYEKNALRRVVGGLNREMVRRLLHDAACVDVVSPAQRDVAIELYPDLESRVHVVDNGVDTAHFTTAGFEAERAALGFAPDDVVVGYVGTAPLRRGGKEVIETVADLSQSNVRGLVIGDGGEASELRRHAEREGVSDRVLVYGEVDYGRVPPLMGAMDIGLSIRRGKEREQSELKVRQYLAAGLCVVGTAGSNDFLKGKPFATVVESHERSEVGSAVGAFVRKGRGALATLGAQSRAFAEATLSMRARNDERLALWSGINGRSGADVRPGSTV